jgi:hypothetical protein
MYRTIVPVQTAASLRTAVPVLIAIGLGGLIASAWLPVPVVTAMAVLTLGVTEVTIDRFGHSAALLTIIALHSVIYAGLYGLFIGAALHAATSASVAVRGGSPLVDIAISSVPMAVALQRAVTALRRHLAGTR